MMTRARIGTWLMVGWAFMVPIRGKNGQIMDDLPVTRWAHMSSYDSARDCEQEKSKLLDLAKGGEELYRKALNLSLCLPMEVVYPPAPPAAAR